VKRLAVSRTDSTVNYIEVVVSCMVESIATKPYTGSIHLSEYMDKFVKAMDKNEFLQFTPSIEVLNSTSDLSMMAPLTIGDKCLVSGLSSCSLDVDFNGVVYTVPTECGTKNYPRPSGLGASVATNNVVLMYPDIQQYMVSSDLRKSSNDYTGFLCCCSAQSSASTKGTIKYLVYGTVIRCY
jgi:hypothetical protein